MPIVARTRIAIFAVLDEHGPLHVSAIAEILQMDQRTVQDSVKCAHERKLLHISGWKRSFGTKGRWGAIYSLGYDQDRKPPQGNPKKQADQRYREKYRKVLRLRDNKRDGRSIDPWLSLLGGL